jgi:hypothetical protein
MRERTVGLMLGGCALVLALLVGACSSTGTNTSPSTTKATFCGLLVAFRASNDTLDVDVTSGGPAAAQTALTRLVSQAKALEKRAPDDIRPDVATVGAFIDKLDALFSKYGYDLAKLSADPKAVEEYTAINDADVQAALGQLRAYGDVDCADVTSTVATAVTLTTVATPTLPIDVTSTVGITTIDPNIAATSTTQSGPP